MDRSSPRPADHAISGFAVRHTLWRRPTPRDGRHLKDHTGRLEWPGTLPITLEAFMRIGPTRALPGLLAMTGLPGGHGLRARGAPAAREPEVPARRVGALS